jgi:hypothetical protein
MKRWKKGVIIASAIVGIAAVIGGIAIRHVTYLRYPDGKDHIDYRDVPDNILLREVYIPSSAEYIARFTFYFCESLRRVDMNEGLHAIGARAFSGCRKLREINLPTTVNFIGAGAFHFCDNLQTVQMPPVLDSIRDHTFSYCFRLREINIPDSLVYIGISAFDMCNSLTHVELPATLYYIGYLLFFFYALFALWRYFRFSRANYVCGNCGRNIHQKGICPHCGAMNT